MSTVGSKDNHLEKHTLTNLLNPHGLSELQILPRRNNESFAKGWATFHTYEGIVAADKAINAIKINGLSVKSIVNVHASHRIPSRQYQAQHALWNMEMPGGVKLRIENEKNHVRLQLQANGKEAVAQSKSLVDRLIKGEVFSKSGGNQPGEPLWEPFLASEEAEHFLQKSMMIRDVMSPLIGGENAFDYLAPMKP